MKIQVGFNRRFDHNFRRIRDLVQQGAIGDPHIVRITSRDPAPPPPEYVKVSGGIFLDMTIHDFDMARYLAGSDAVEVYAQRRRARGPGNRQGRGRRHGGRDADVCQTAASASSTTRARPPTATTSASRCSAPRAPLACGNDTPSSVTLSNEAGVAGDKPLYFFLERYRQAFIDEMNAFFDVVDRREAESRRGHRRAEAAAHGICRKEVRGGRPRR